AVVARPAWNAARVAADESIRQSSSLLASNQMKALICGSATSWAKKSAIHAALSPPRVPDATSESISGRLVRLATSASVGSNTCANDDQTCHWSTGPQLYPPTPPSSPYA